MKKIWILLGCLLLTGCNVKYNVNIDSDLKVVESANVEGDEELYSTYYRTSRNKVLQHFLDLYGESLTQNNYEYQLVKGEYPHVELKRKYDNISAYLESSRLFNGYFDKIDYQKNGNIIKIETIGFNYNILDDPDRFYVNSLEIAITLANKVTNHNASKVDEKTNTYYYTLDSNTEDFKILLEFDASRKFNPYAKAIRQILISILIIMATWGIIYFVSRKKR